MRLLGNSKPPCDRSIKWHTKHLQPVSKEASRLIFHDMYPDSEGDPDVDSLLAAVGHMPYAVILMAKNGEVSGSTPGELLEEWKQTGTGMFEASGSPEDDMNRSIGLSVDCNFVTQNPSALLLLQTLALLPVGTSKANLKEWIPDIKSRSGSGSVSSAILTLSNAALLLQSDGPPMTPKILSILPVVQSFMQTTPSRIPDEVRQNVHKACHRFILDHISQCETHPQDVDSIVVTEDRNVHFILLNANPINLPISLDLHVKYVNYFAAASRHWQSLDISEHALSLAQKLGDQKMIARAWLKLAAVYSQKNVYDTAEQCLSESYDVWSKLADPDSTPETLDCGLLLAHCRLLLKRPLSAIIEFLNTLPVAPNDYFLTALVKCQLGECHRQSGQLPKALDMFQEAKDLFTRTGHLKDVADALSNISDVYFSSSQFEKALRSILEAREAAEGAGIAMTRFSNAFINFKHGSCLLMLHRDMEALPIFQECLSIYESAGDFGMAAWCFRHMGLIHLRQGNRAEACVAFDAARAKLTELGNEEELKKLEGYIEEMKRCFPQ